MTHTVRHRRLIGRPGFVLVFPVQASDGSLCDPNRQLAFIFKLLLLKKKTLLLFRGILSHSLAKCRTLSIYVLMKRKFVRVIIHDIILPLRCKCYRHPSGIWTQRRLVVRHSFNVTGSVTVNCLLKCNEDFHFIVKLIYKTHIWWGVRGGALSYNPEGRGFRFPTGSLWFFTDLVLPAALWLWDRRILQQKWVPGVSPEG
jgi:hypothetical protein